MTNIDRELDVVDQYQSVLQGHLKDVDIYLKKEGRRAEVRFDEGRAKVKQPSDLDPGPVPNALDQAAVTDFLHRVHATTKNTMLQLDRCKGVIEKLHKDCDDVAKSNADLLHKLKECEQMIQEILPPLSVRENDKKSGIYLTEVGFDTASISSQTPRSKRDEADSVMTTVRSTLQSLKNDLEVQKIDREDCSRIIVKMMEDLDMRKATMTKRSGVPSSDGKITKSSQDLSFPPIKEENALMVMPKEITLRPAVEKLAEKVKGFVHQDKELSPQMIVAKADLGTRYQGRSTDNIDRDLVKLQREIRRENRDTAMYITNKIIEATKAEKRVCLKLLEEINRVVISRKNKLSKNPTTSVVPKKRKRMISRHGNAIETNLCEKLTLTNTSIKEYIEMESKQAEKFYAEGVKKKEEYAKEVMQKNITIKELEQEVRVIQAEREKYKKLLELEKQSKKQEKEVNTQKQESTSLLTKAVIPKRSKPFHHSGKVEGLQVTVDSAYYSNYARNNKGGKARSNPKHTPNMEQLKTVHEKARRVKGRKRDNDKNQEG